jgi:hypothetical protein
METCWYAKPEWWLVILGAPTLVFIGWQAWETRRAASAARDAVIETGKNASAALLNAEAIINSERPWIFVEVGQPSQKARNAHVQFTAWNRGRTPAEIIVYTCESQPFITADDLTPDPVYPKVELMYKKYVAPDQSFPLLEPSYDCSTALTDSMWDQMNSRRQRLYFVGHVVYRDLITHKEHETRFCYWLSSADWVGFIMSGPRTYNQHT